ncbi:MAG: hypothetical protein NVS4B3_16620 [Gemmatimonadaceae bacterium]
MIAEEQARRSPPRLPPLVRILLFVVIAVAATSVALTVTSALDRALGIDATALGQVRRVAAGAVSELVGVLLATLVMLRAIERRGWAFVGLELRRVRWGTLVGAATLGAAAIGLPSLGLIGMGWLRRVPGDSSAWPFAVGALLVVLLPAALAEELAIRGYPFAVLRARWGTTTAVIATSLIFGLLHAANPGARLEPIALVVLAGAFLASILIVTRSLYAAWVAHFAWNFTLAGVVHAAVSGETLPPPVTHGGPEGGAAAGAGMVLASLVLFAPRMARGYRLRLRRRAEFAR